MAKAVNNDVVAGIVAIILGILLVTDALTLEIILGVGLITLGVLWLIKGL